jgi:hypothetical protein
MIINNFYKALDSSKRWSSLSLLLCGKYDYISSKMALIREKWRKKIYIVKNQIVHTYYPYISKARGYVFATGFATILNISYSSSGENSVFTKVPLFIEILPFVLVTIVGEIKFSILTLLKLISSKFFTSIMGMFS